MFMKLSERALKKYIKRKIVLLQENFVIYKGVKIMNFTDKTALVTGAAVGIGRAVALKLAI